MPYDPTRSIQDSPDLSPTTLVMQYLQRKGIKPNNANISQALRDAGRDPNLIPGLRVQGAADQGEEPRPKGASGGPSVGQRGNVAKQVEGQDDLGANRIRRAQDQGYVDSGSFDTGPSGGATPPMDRRGEQQTSAPRQPANLAGRDITDMVMPLFGVGPAAIAGAQAFMGNRGATPRGPIDVNPDALVGPEALGLPAPAPTQPSGQRALTYDEYETGEGPLRAAPTAEQVMANPAEAAMQKALAPPGPQPSDVVPPQPPVSEGDMTRAAVGDLGRPNAQDALRMQTPTAMTPARAKTAGTWQQLFDMLIGGRR